MLDKSRVTQSVTLWYFIHQGPISSTSLRRVFVLKTSYEVRTLKIGFHQTIEPCELLTFCRIFKVVRDPCQKITLLLPKSKSVRVIVPESCF